MEDINAQVRRIFRLILQDIAVDLGDEFDQNFERQAFFSQKWQRHRSPLRPGGHILVDTGRLRGSVHSEIRDSSIVFCTNEPYAAIHNEGGEIVVTEKMKKFFWRRYYETTGSFGRRKDGSLRKTKQNRQLTDVAEFWKAMALMKAGKTIKIPQRRFLGTSPEVEESVRRIIEGQLTEYINQIDFNIK